MLVLLFDIDGTLINTGGAGGAALRQAFCSEFEVAEAGDVPFSGRTDRAIGSSLFELHQIDDSVQNWERLRAAYVRELPIHLPQRTGCVLPGVSNLLACLAARDDVAVGLLTGNVREGARIKLEYYGLYRHFAFGGFGDHHMDRDYVAQEALAAAREHIDGRAAIRFVERNSFRCPAKRSSLSCPAKRNEFRSTEQVWVIGDTPLDVRCARSINARVLAVATGVHPKEELVAARPDVLLDDLSDTSQILGHLYAESLPSGLRFCRSFASPLRSDE